MIKQELTDRIAILEVTNAKGQKKDFRCEKFKIEKALEVALLVHKDVLSLVPTQQGESFNFESLNPSLFIKTIKQVFQNTVNEENEQTINTNCSDIEGSKLTLDWIIPLFMEVIEYNDFFTLLGLESTIQTMLDYMKENIAYTQYQMTLETIILQDLKIPTIEMELDMMLNPEKYQEQEPQIEDLQSLTTAKTSKKVKKTKREV